MRYVTNMLANPGETKNRPLGSVSSVAKAMEVYLKNSYVCLSSVKQFNPDVECILFLNFELDEYWKNLYSRKNIKTIFLEFGKYSIDSSFSWSIVQYRYDMINYLCENMTDEDQVIMIDTDVVCNGSLDLVFEEIKHRIYLFDVQHASDNRDRKSIIDNYLKIYPGEDHCVLIHYGGEFIGATRKELCDLLEESQKVIELGNKTEGLVNFNDEHITSIAVYNMQKRGKQVNNANAYIYRYWTAHAFRNVEPFYLTSTNYRCNPVVLWHLPSEKRYGIPKVFKYLVKKGKLPSAKSMAKLFGFPKSTRPRKFRYFCKVFYHRYFVK